MYLVRPLLSAFDPYHMQLTKPDLTVCFGESKLELEMIQE